MYTERSNKVGKGIQKNKNHISWHKNLNFFLSFNHGRVFWLGVFLNFDHGRVFWVLVEGTFFNRGRVIYFLIEGVFFSFNHGRVFQVLIGACYYIFWLGACYIVLIGDILALMEGVFFFITKWKVITKNPHQVVTKILRHVTCVCHQDLHQSLFYLLSWAEASLHTGSVASYSLGGHIDWAHTHTRHSWV